MAKLKPTSGPFVLPRSWAIMAAYGYGLWVRLLGENRAKRLVIAGLAVSSIAAVILNLAT